MSFTAIDNGTFRRLSLSNVLNGEEDAICAPGQFAALTNAIATAVLKLVEDGSDMFNFRLNEGRSNEMVDWVFLSRYRPAMLRGGRIQGARVPGSSQVSNSPNGLCFHSLGIRVICCRLKRRWYAYGEHQQHVMKPCQFRAGIVAALYSEGPRKRERRLRMSISHLQKVNGAHLEDI